MGGQGERPCYTLIASPTDTLPTVEVWSAMQLPLRPRDVSELRERVESGELRESRVLEFKRQFPKKNEALARQLAGLAADGGVIVLGVAETDSGLRVEPIESRGARERVEQIARDIPQPPVQVASYVLDSDRPGFGVLWVEIPSSSYLAHEVAGTYYARDDTQTRPMRDAEVDDRLALRRDRPLPLLEMLDQALKREEPSAPSLHARTCVVARPIGASRDEFFQPTRKLDAWEDFAYAVQQPKGSLPPVPQRYWGQLSQRFALPRFSPATDRDIELQENGALAHLSYSQDWYEANRDGVFLPSVLRACDEAISLIGAVQVRTRQRRMWDLAFSISGVEGRTGRSDRRDFRPPPYPLSIPRDEYREHILGVSTDLLEGDPRSVVEALAGRFIAECGFEFGCV